MANKYTSEIISDVICNASDDISILRKVEIYNEINETWKQCRLYELDDSVEISISNDNYVVIVTTNVSTLNMLSMSIEQIKLDFRSVLNKWRLSGIRVKKSDVF